MNKRKFQLLIALLCLSILLVVGSYVIYFGQIKGYSLSASPSEWGQFGDYIGGTLNPIFSFLAFIGVLLTVYLQSEQLRIAQKQALLEEIQRLISGLSKEIDTLFQQAPKTIPKEFPEGGHPFTVWFVLSALGTAFLNKNKNAEIMKEKTLHCIDLDLGAIIIEIHQLTWALEKYRLEGGSGLVIEFYRKRYEPSVCWLNAIGFLDQNERILDFFKPEEFEDGLKSSGAV